MSTYHNQLSTAFTSTYLDPTFYTVRAFPPSSPSRSLCGSSSSRSSPGRNRASKACAYCRLRKIRCDGAAVCANCSRTKRCCEYTEVTDEENRATKERKAFLKAQKLATGVSGRTPRGGMKQSMSCPLLEGWSPKKEVVRANDPTPFDPTSSKPYPSVLLFSPLATNNADASVFNAPATEHLSPATSSSAYTSYFSSSPSTPEFYTPPSSPLYSTSAYTQSAGAVSFSTPTSYLIPSTATQLAYHTKNPSYPSALMDISLSPVGCSSFAPLPEEQPQHGLNVGFFEFKASDASFYPTAVAPQPSQAAPSYSYLPDLDFVTLEPFMGDGWVGEQTYAYDALTTRQ